jgi:hypothetical protein
VRAEGGPVVSLSYEGGGPEPSTSGGRCEGVGALGAAPLPRRCKVLWRLSFTVPIVGHYDHDSEHYRDARGVSG